MHLEPGITRFCSVQRCRLLIEICAASFSRGGNPSYARHSTFSILIAGNHSGIKIQNATGTRLIRPSWRVTTSRKFLFPLYADHDRNLLDRAQHSWDITRPGLGEPNPPESLMKYVSWARWQTERIRFFVRRREFKIHNLNGCCKMVRKHGYRGPALGPPSPRCRDSFVQ